MRIRRFFHTILAVIALAIVWQMVSTWSRAMPGVPAESARAPKKDRPATALPARVARIGQRLARHITDKDLFSPDRKRPAAVQKTVVAEPIPPPSHLSLVGVLLTPGREEAFLADSSQGNRVTRVQKGEQIERYRLTRLTASEATLALGDNSGEVALPLALLSSKKAKSLPQLIPKKAPVKRTNQTQSQDAEAGNQAAVEAGGDDPARIRENIRQLQRRLRTIRRQAARDRRAERERDRAAEQAEEPAEAAEPAEAEQAPAAEAE